MGEYRETTTVPDARISSVDGKVLSWNMPGESVVVDPTIFIRPERHERAFEAETIVAAREQLDRLASTGEPIVLLGKPYDYKTESAPSPSEYDPEGQATLAIARALEDLRESVPLDLPDSGTRADLLDYSKKGERSLVTEHDMAVTGITRGDQVLVVERQLTVHGDPRSKLEAQHKVEIKYVSRSVTNRLLLEERQAIQARKRR